MSGSITHTLPMLQLVCNLVIVDNPTTIADETQPLTAAPAPAGGLLSDGWVAYPEFGAAYKVFNESVVWTVANRRCLQQGAYLAAIDTFDKILAVRNQEPSMARRHVGLHLLDDTATNWFNLHTGLDIGQSSLPWAAGQPSGNGRCMSLQSGYLALGRTMCSSSNGGYVCEVPYSPKNREVAFPIMQ